MEKNGWELDTKDILQGYFFLKKSLGDSEITLISQTQDISKKKRSMEAQNAIDFLSSVHGDQLDYVLSKQLSKSADMKNTVYEMSSEFIIEVRNKAKNKSGLVLTGYSTFGDIVLENVYRCHSRLEDYEGEFFGEVVEKYPGIEVSMVEPNFHICLYEYLRIYGVDEMLIACVEGLSVALEDKKAIVLTRKLEDFFSDM